MRRLAKTSRTVSNVSACYRSVNANNDVIVRFSLKDLEKDFARTEDDIKAVQSVGQIIGEVMKQLDDERCMSTGNIIHSEVLMIVRAQSS